MYYFTLIIGIFLHFNNYSNHINLKSNNKVIKTFTSKKNDTTRYIGEYYEGGIIFHLWKDSLGNDHGLIVSIVNQSNGEIWSSDYNNEIGKKAKSSWDGYLNTVSIINSGIKKTNAAKLCYELKLNGKDDWYLPSIDELNKLFNNRFDVNKALISINGSEQLEMNSTYWSSTENSKGYAYAFLFGTGFYSELAKQNEYFVRAIRSF
jgi:hypothetical protein